MTNKIDEDFERELDKQFPKGDKSRGKALVLFALAQIKINCLREQVAKLIGDNRGENT